MKAATKLPRAKGAEILLLQARVKELEETILHLEKNLIHDKLTGLKTRAFFENEAKVYLELLTNAQSAKASRRKQWFTLKHISFIFIDIDHFKKINDKFGHDIGDEVLKAVANTIKLSLREEDTAARWGGEEIIMTLVGATEQNAFDKAEDIRRQVEGLKFSKLGKFSITVSAGVASVESGQTLDTMMKRVDRALYKAKETGRDKVVKFSSLKQPLHLDEILKSRKVS